MQLLDKFCRHIGPSKRMISAVKQMLGPHDLITALKGFNVVANRVNVQSREVVLDGMP